MSLFGGDTDGSGSAYEPEESPNPTSPPTRREQDAPYVPTLYSIPDVDYNDGDNDFDAQSEEELSPDEDVARPNRFAGKPSTWRGYTATERQIAASLDQIQAGDLAAHLYNAHVLKKRGQLPRQQLANIRDWHHKDRWMKKGDALKYVDIAGDEQTELIPTKWWTAWPLPMGKAPAAHERFGPWEPEYAGTIGGLGEAKVGDELREELLASFLAQAKEKWQARDPESDSEAQFDARRSKKLNAESRTPGSTPGVVTDNDDEGGLDTGSEVDDESQGTSIHKPKEKRSHIQLPVPNRPVLLADDDRARRILQPSINALLSQLDNLAEAIHITRLNHFGHRARNDTSASEATDAESVRSSSSSLSRSRSKSLREDVSRANSRAPSRRSRAPSGSQQHRRKSTKSQKGSNRGSGLGTDSDDEVGHDDSSRTDRAKSLSRRSSIDSLFNTDAKAHVGLMDWSEVLGLASMTGWNANAIHRTAQRCAALFGETMDFRLFDEGLSTEPIPDPVQYTPSTIPGPADLTTSHAASLPKRPYFEPGTVRCPHTECQDHVDFQYPYRVIEHVRRVHGYDPRTNDSDNEDRKVGGVHIDGFMRPVTRKPGGTGASREKGGGGGKARGKRAKSENGAASSPPPLTPTALV